MLHDIEVNTLEMNGKIFSAENKNCKKEWNRNISKNIIPEILKLTKWAQ